ncbi:unnamed protein product [Rotaria socialis]|uniref:Uncharacterized protein n=1 Tax=Rotaria socialis TaxID=392032 RepID=A0A818QT54_9BILA|nr:unnamed protein product [Rotaria socialis]CAF4213350.1 unnamed protein product [Rotaria socialis]
MQTSNIKLIEKSELNLDDDFNQDQNSSPDINQLACSLKNKIFSKYISNYLTEKVEQMWILYEKRIDKFFKENHFNITCSNARPQIAMKLEELAKYQQDNIETCKRDIEILCSLRRRLRHENKYSVQLQSSQRPPTSSSSIRVPKTPRCIDRSKVTTDIYKDDTYEFDDSKRNKISNQELNALSLSSYQHNRRQCIFKHGEILPLDSTRKTRTIRVTYLCNN